MSQLTCSFCRKNTENLTAGPNVWICPRCAVICLTIYRDERPDSAAELHYSVDGVPSIPDAPQPTEPLEGPIRCSFGGKPLNEVEILITATAGAAICSECFLLIIEILLDAEPALMAELGVTERRAAG